MFVSISIWWRKWKEWKASRKLLDTFYAWKSHIDSNYQEKGPTSEAVILVKLDDIGDYILFRNLLSYYKNYAGNNRLILVGNEAWKSIFEYFDSNEIDEVIWINKNKYFDQEDYRHNIWHNIHSKNASTIIAPSLTRSLLLDDMMVIASGASNRLGGYNTHENKTWNAVSNELYTALYDIDRKQFEFNTNVLFLENLLGHNIPVAKSYLPKIAYSTDLSTPYIGIFIGANIKSRRWYSAGWVSLIQQLAAKYPSYTWVLLGGPADVHMATEIKDALTGVKLENRVGAQSLIESMAILQQAKLVITNNTMSYHVTMASGIPTVIITSGDKYYRFTEIDQHLYKNIFVVYPKRFETLRKRGDIKGMQQYYAVKHDIRSISVEEVMNIILQHKFLDA